MYGMKKIIIFAKNKSFTKLKKNVTNYVAITFILLYLSHIAEVEGEFPARRF